MGIVIIHTYSNVLLLGNSCYAWYVAVFDLSYASEFTNPFV